MIKKKKKNYSFKNEFVSSCFGWSCLAMGVVDFTLEETLSVWALTMMLTSSLATQLFISTAAAWSMTYFNYYFWGSAIFENARHFMKKVLWHVGCAESEGEDVLSLHLTLKEPGKSKASPLLFYGLSVTSVATTFALSSFYVRESMKEAFHMQDNDPRLLITAYVAGVISMVHYASTEIMNTWREEFADDPLEDEDADFSGSDYIVEKFTIAILGAVVLGYQAWLAIYLEMGLWTTSVAYRTLAASFVAVMQMVLTFYFQGEVLLGETQEMKALDSWVQSISQEKRFAFMAVMGLVSTVVCYSTHRIAMKELLESIIYGRFSVDGNTLMAGTTVYSCIDAVSKLAGFSGAQAEVFSEFAGVNEKILPSVEAVSSDESDFLQDFEFFSL